MLGFGLTGEQAALQRRARAFARDVVAPHVEEMDRTNAYPWPVVKAMAREGLTGLTIPEEYGGGGRPLIDAILVVEELARVCGTVARICVDANTAIPGAIRHYGTEAQRERFLPGIAAGDKPAIAITEPEAGSAATALTTAAVRDGDTYVHAAEMASAVTNAALQIHGAAGYSCDLPLERMVRDARMFTIGGGTAQVQRNLIARHVLRTGGAPGAAGDGEAPHAD